MTSAKEVSVAAASTNVVEDANVRVLLYSLKVLSTGNQVVMRKEH